ncbi:MAG: sigma-70 family RNA polymerase sigma factor [Lachnospiraceae bacterium]|nr:sigma-70 family RNA polymerase sigma factor [Lachnospiraceae bacterium]
MSDAEIVQLYRNRDERAIQVTMEQYRNYLMKIAVQILGDEQDAEECVNDTYQAAWLSIPEQRPETLSVYLGKIVRQEAIDRLRSRQRVKRQGTEYAASLEELSEVVAGGRTPEQEADAAFLKEAIARFIKELPDDARNLFLGRYFYFDSLKETAAYLHMSESKAKSMLLRLRRKLKRFLCKEGFII